jgi:phosphatidylserine/phosphatidylglycerophosphate/cardiolipin synthase-like enzyme
MEPFKPCMSELKDIDLYIGIKAGKRIENHIKDTKGPIRIISPYLGNKQIEKLIKKKKSGVTVEVISTDGNNDFKDPHNSKLLKNIIKQERIPLEREQKKRNSFRKISNIIIVFLFAIAFSLIYFKPVIHNIVIAVTLTIMITIFLKIKYKKWRVYNYKYNTVFPIKFINHPKYNANSKNNKFIHSKVFIIGKTAYVGSVNMTPSGMKYSVESCLTIKDKDTVTKLYNYFDYLFNYNWEARDLNYYGSLIYQEPPN